MNRVIHTKAQRIGLTDVRWTSGFWADRFAVCCDSIVPSMLRLMRDQERVRFVGNFEVAAGRSQGRHRGPKWNDGDFYKWFEAAAAILAYTQDSQLRDELNQLAELIAAAQEPDGYIHTDVQIRQRAGEAVARFGEPMDFEMYNMGHLMSAACVHHAATGDSKLLRCALRAADCLIRQFAQPSPAIARHGICPAHLMGLTDLYRTTGDPKYLELALKLLNMRNLVANGDDDNQDRIPFREQRQMAGHAVRATYLYAGAADLFAEGTDDSLLPPLLSLWEDMVAKKLYITGGCGALFDGASPDGSPDQIHITRVHQAFGRNYQLPHSAAHNETCAAIGSFLWSWRMFLVTGENRFADLLEQTLYNSILAGVSVDGTRYFYTNTLRQLEPMPVELRWNRHRRASIGCFCCPPNVARILAQSASYAYATSDSNLWVVLYGSNELRTKIDGETLQLQQVTNYPWNGDVRIHIQSAPSHPITIHLRVPAWCRGASVRVNGDSVEKPAPGSFHAITRAWKADDVLELSMPLVVRKLEAHPLAEEARNQVAVMRGPLVYCLESVDLPPGINLLDVRLPATATFTPTTDPTLPGIAVLQGQAIAINSEPWDGQLYRELTLGNQRPINLKLIPYYAWDNRDEGEMTVWLPLAG